MARSATARIKQELEALADPAVAQKSLRFFKTGKNQYAEKDRFIGLSVPVIRAKVKENFPLSIADTTKLLSSPIHEIRLFAVLMLVALYQKGEDTQKQAVFDCYLSNTQYVNNWDLVDSSAYKIMGPHLEYRDRGLLNELALSTSLWERRIAVMTTFHFIRQGEFDDALRLCDMLMHDEEDLIHKASGWMVREVGNKNRSQMKAWLKPRYKTMPRTMLRYAIEKLPKPERDDYLQSRVC